MTKNVLIFHRNVQMRCCSIFIYFHVGRIPRGEKKFSQKRLFDYTVYLLIGIFFREDCSPSEIPH